MSRSEQRTQINAVSCLFKDRIESVIPGDESRSYAESNARYQTLYTKLANLQDESGREILMELDEVRTAAEREMLWIFYRYGFTDSVHINAAVRADLNSGMDASLVEERISAIACHTTTMSQVATVILGLVSDESRTKQDVAVELSKILREMASAMPCLPSGKEISASVPR